MPVEFSTDEQVARLGTFSEVPAQAELERVFFRDDADRALVRRHRAEHSRVTGPLNRARLSTRRAELSAPKRCAANARLIEAQQVAHSTLDLCRRCPLANAAAVGSISFGQGPQMSHGVGVRIHVDTDLGGDPDDACAVAMLLGWPGVEIVGITTTIDPNGSRAGCVEHLLSLAGRGGIPVVAGAARSTSTQTFAHPYTGDARYWPGGIAARRPSAGAVLDALERSIGMGATVVTLGPLTNLALLETVRPGALAQARVVAMGGWVQPPAADLPAWGPDMDWNLQWDTQAAQTVVHAVGALTLVPLPAALSAPVRDRELPRLRASGPLGQLLAKQCQARAADAEMCSLGRAYNGLPNDLLNFHYDPVTCAVATGWPHAVIEKRQLGVVVDNNTLHLVPDNNGRQLMVVTEVDGEAFAADWLTAVETASTPAARF